MPASHGVTATKIDLAGNGPVTMSMVSLSVLAPTSVPRRLRAQAVSSTDWDSRSTASLPPGAVEDLLLVSLAGHHEVAGEPRARPWHILVGVGVDQRQPDLLAVALAGVGDGGLGLVVEERLDGGDAGRRVERRRVDGRVARLRGAWPVVPGADALISTLPFQMEMASVPPLCGSGML